MQLNFNIYQYNNHFFYLLSIVLISFYYSCIINFFPQESITYAKTILGHYQYNYTNGWFIFVKNQPISLQIYLPIFLIKIGVNEIFLNYFWSFLTCLISYFSLFYFLQIITKNYFLSFIVPLFFFFHRFVDTHWYGVYYPTSFFYFGQMGMYLCLLSMSLLLLNKQKLSLIILIVNFFAHAAWGAFNLVALILLIFLRKEKIKITPVHFSLVLILLSLTFYVNNQISKIDINNSPTYNELSKTEIKEEKNNILLQDFDNSKIAYKISHSPYFDLSFNNLKKNLLEITRFLFYEILLVIFLIFHRKKINEQTRQFAWTLTILSGLVIFYYFFNKVFHINNLFLLIDLRIPNLIDRMLITRFLNINNLIVLVFSLGFLINLAIRKNNYYVKLYFILLLTLFNLFLVLRGYYVVDLWLGISTLNIDRFICNFFIWINVVFCFVYLFFYNYNFEESYKKKINYIKIKRIFDLNIILFVLIILFYLLPLKYLNVSKFNSANLKLFNSIENNNYNEVIVGPLIYGYIDPSYFSKTSIILPSFYIKSLQNDQYVDIYCDNQRDVFVTTSDYFNYIEDQCFRDRPKKDWLKIAKHLNSKYIITRRNVNLNLDLVNQNNFIKLYQIK